MDPKLKIEYLDLIAREINSKSLQFEPSTNWTQSTTEALHLLSQLDHVTENSLAPLPPPITVRNPASQNLATKQGTASTQSSASVSAPSKTFQYSSHRPEYRPALQNPGVLQALLKLRQKQAQKNAHSTPLPRNLATKTKT